MSMGLTFGGKFKLPFEYKITGDIAVYKVDDKIEYEIPEGTKMLIIFCDVEIVVDFKEITDWENQGMYLARQMYHEVPVANKRKLYIVAPYPPSYVRIMPVG